MVIDRFARSGELAEDYTYCKKRALWGPNFEGGGYCGGTIQGIISKLDYIQDMGFDCIWITPPVQSNSFMGYDATNLYEINPHFGTKADMKELAEDLHQRKMCLVIDFVLNHMAPLHKNGKMVLNKIVPFDDSVYYHQRDRPATMSFKDYVVGTDQWNGPVQAGMYTQNDSKILGTLVKEKKATCGPNVPQQTECSCFPGNSGEVCPHYTTSLQVEGWMGGLGDLNHSHPFVQQELLNYAVDLVQDYGADALRLDTAIYLDLQFVKEVQQAVGVEILGEATVNNLTYQAYLMRDEKNERILTGLLNFPPFYQVPTAFCGFNMGGEFGDWSMQGTWSDKGPDM